MRGIQMFRSAMRGVKRQGRAIQGRPKTHL